VSYSYRQLISAPRGAVFSLCCDLKKLFRLNPQWEVLSLEQATVAAERARFDLTVEYDRAETKASFQGTVEAFVPNSEIAIKLNTAQPRRIILRFDDAGDKAALVTYEEEGEAETPPEEKRELMLWVQSIANYAQLSQKKTVTDRVCLWVVDRVWLKMSPAGKRIVLLILVSEAAGFVFFILLLLWLLIFKKF